MCIVIKSRPEFKMGHVGSKTRSLGQFLEKPCVLSRRHSFDPVFMKLCQNDFLTLNKRLSRRAMLSDDSSCSGHTVFLSGGIFLLFSFFFFTLISLRCTWSYWRYFDLPVKPVFGNNVYGLTIWHENTNICPNVCHHEERMI